MADIKALLVPIEEGGDPTDAEWAFAERQLDIISAVSGRKPLLRQLELFLLAGGDIYNTSVKCRI
ncbi:hypothetical protein LHT11_01680 [Acetobacter indonesiensis]|uniref:hypothetical protein n=1 Tax=Acetobacter indonesiensis TaxID=104101 RepID=UPI001F23F78C|nr:hypothetical protein [Acetobacter indonesiensis]MCG0993911.1 hypothetical protein [Acetobacter indonesiensis]